MSFRAVGTAAIAMNGQLKANISRIRRDHLLLFFNDTATTEIYTALNTLSLHDALP
eukprot:COSAG01_NODE_64318_length_277_cov_0.567416_1_plen_55_part_10